MDIFGQLGINTTAAFQFVLFAIALIFLSKVVFAPYTHALEERENRTKGGEDLAVEFSNKAAELQSQYETKLRALNSETKSIMDAARTKATQDYESTVSGVRTEAEKMVQENRKTIAQSVQAAAAELKSQSPAVAMAITQKLLK